MKNKKSLLKAGGVDTLYEPVARFENNRCLHMWILPLFLVKSNRNKQFRENREINKGEVYVKKAVRHHVSSLFFIGFLKTYLR